MKRMANTTKEGKRCSRAWMRYPLSIASIVVLFSGCAEYLGNRSRSGSIDLRLPSKSGSRVAEDTQRVTELVRTIAEQHALARRLERSVQNSEGLPTLYVVPGLNLSSGAWPGQPDVDWDADIGWERLFDRPRDLPDRLACELYPPRTGDVLKIHVWVNYASRMPPTAKALWADLTTELVSQFGREAIVKLEDLE